MDTPITRTDDDALAARASAVKLGYWQDDYIKHFCKQADRKAPVINRGTYLRTRAIDQACARFLQLPETGTKQIISLGAGSDTRFFRLAQPFVVDGTDIPFKYHELDFPHVTQRKAMTLTTKKALKDVLHYQTTCTVNARAGSIYSSHYNLHPIDLRSLHETELPGVDMSLPTLIISEVCLIYMDLEKADRVLSWTKRFTSAGVVLYEPIGGNDAFGKMMVKNLASRGLQLKTLEQYATLALQQERLLHVGGMTHAQASDMNALERDLPQEERERIAKLEMFDEVEEWKMLAAHYCFAIGWRGPSAEAMLSLR
ncbi:S-adenosyl-L-methionine-dependent methyltransferase [Protomyces lactucae-debilis]|uniref:Leucine carboxyl methyltransferase 1 n=1 Tax=Protomyces lactucae-debilis TaxID=2754530 RepID=A0A1Y2F6C0_PROLT|nr:S-adenosyl-L-methionine-dependent methyltransferase [Protomyces lactucae-debilis]ORY79389.1 S-adenosyl-L-methionine-dependent methyltransferase [Protomyces lactucae-debilis]